MRFGLMGSGLKPQGMPPASAFRDLGARVEELGYDSLWVADRIASGSAGLPLLEGTAALGAFIGFTRHIRLGTSVLIAPVRHPALLAKQLASLDYLSEGRVTFGLGIGENPHDYAAVQVAYRERGRRADDLLACLRQVWNGGGEPFSGRHYSVPAVWLEPAPSRPGGPPIWIGGSSAAALVRAGRLGDGWLGYRLSPSQFAECLTRARQEADRSGRDPARLAGAIMLPAHCGLDGPAARRQVQETLSRRFGVPIPIELVEQTCLAGSPAECVDRLAEYARAGVEEVILAPQAWSHDPVADAESIFAGIVQNARSGLC